MSSLQLGIVFGLGALIFGGLANSFVKIPSRELGTNKTIFYRNVFDSLFLLVILLFTLSQSNFSLVFIVYTLILSLIGYIPMYFFYRAMAIGKVGVIAPVSSSYALVTLILATIFLKESVTPLQILSILVIVSGVILISVNFKEFKSSQLLKMKSGIPYALIAALGWGIWYILSRFSAKELGPYLAALIIEAGAIPVAYSLIRKEKTDLKINNKKAFYFIIPLALMMTLWSLCYYQGARVSNLSVVVALSSASPLVVAIYGRIFYKEKLTLHQYLAIGLIVAGVIALSLI